MGKTVRRRKKKRVGRIATVSEKAQRKAQDEPEPRMVLCYLKSSGKFAFRAIR